MPISPKLFTLSAEDHIKGNGRRKNRRDPKRQLAFERLDARNLLAGDLGEIVQLNAYEELVPKDDEVADFSMYEDQRNAMHSIPEREDSTRAAAIDLLMAEGES